MQIIAPEQPPHILQIYRERLKPGSESAYHAIEEDTARMAAALGCPHPYLGAESVTGSKEVWWFNGYESPAEQQQVYDNYAKNASLMAALQQNSKRKANLTLAPIEAIARYRPDLTVGDPWLVGHGRFLVITVTKSDRRVTGTVFEASDGTCYVVAPAQTREEADAAKFSSGPDSIILAVRPSWSFPDKKWIASDSPFWQRRTSSTS
jgi:hypothetical protein